MSLESLGLGSLGQLMGLKVIESEHCSERIQFRFSRGKKKRIQKKMAKNPKNYKRVPSEEVFIYKTIMICHPEIAKQLYRHYART